jgi:hypothetical protein
VLSSCMAIYKLRLFGANGKVAVVQRLTAATDDEALATVLGMIQRASWVAKFDLWEGERPVEGVAPTMRTGKPRPKKKPRR